jgi:hypothetical protein
VAGDKGVHACAVHAAYDQALGLIFASLRQSPTGCHDDSIWANPKGTGHMGDLSGCSRRALNRHWAAVGGQPAGCQGEPSYFRRMLEEEVDGPCGTQQYRLQERGLVVAAGANGLAVSPNQTWLVSGDSFLPRHSLWCLSHSPDERDTTATCPRRRIGEKA